jgi:hypothetical protein
MRDGYYRMTKWIRKRSQTTAITAIKSWLITCQRRLKSVVSGRYPLGVYVLFWLSVILDLSSTSLTMRSVPQHQWIEVNPLFYTLDSTLFFVIYILTNVSLFLLILHHQVQWKRGASLARARAYCIYLLSFTVHSA